MLGVKYKARGLESAQLKTIQPTGCLFKGGQFLDCKLTFTHYYAAM